jgi:hypothetical protein
MARVGIDGFSPRLQVKDAQFSDEINLKALNQSKPDLTLLVSVLVSTIASEASPQATVLKVAHSFVAFAAHLRG